MNIYISHHPCTCPFASYAISIDRSRPLPPSAARGAYTMDGIRWSFLCLWGFGFALVMMVIGKKFHNYIYIYIYICLLLISMLWHRQAIFKSKGDKLCSSAECRIWTRGPRHQIASRLNARWQTDWAFEDQAKNLNSIARPYDQRAFSPLDPTVSWLSHLALAIYMFVVVNFDALAQASDIQIGRRQVVFLCYMQDLNPGSQTPNRQQTECSLTNWLSYRGSS